MIKKFNDVVEAQHFLREHTYFTKIFKCKSGRLLFSNEFEDHLTWDYVKINPVTDSIDDDKYLNTKTVIWFEYGHWSIDHNSWYGCYYNNFSANTFEEGIITIANNIHKKYGEDFIMDYFIIDEDLKFETHPKNKKLKMITNVNKHSHWKEEELLSRLRYYEIVDNDDNLLEVLKSEEFGETLSLSEIKEKYNLGDE